MGDAMDINNKYVFNWIEEVARITQPDSIYWCNGSETEYQELISEALKQKEFSKIEAKGWENCYRYISDKNSVDHMRGISYICSNTQIEDSKYHKWASAKTMHRNLKNLSYGSMKGKTLYVVPCILGPENSQFAKVGIELTDSLYVAVSLSLISNVGDPAWRLIGDSNRFLKGLHISSSQISHEPMYVTFPDENYIITLNSTYGSYSFMTSHPWSLSLANANHHEYNLLAAHMMIIGIESPEGEVKYIGAASHSSGGKTKLSFVRPDSDVVEFKGYKCYSVADDIVWLHQGPDDRVWAINPELGYFSKLKDLTGEVGKTMENYIRKNTIFSNVPLDQEDNPWWPNKTSELPDMVKDWQNNVRPIRDPEDLKDIAPNSRYIYREQRYKDNGIYTTGVPLSAILFITNNEDTSPIITEAYNWRHGILFGANITNKMASVSEEKSYNPFGIYPYLLTGIGEYIRNWLNLGESLNKPPKIYKVNWNRLDENKMKIWPGENDNFRILEWIFRRVSEKVSACESPIGLQPKTEDIVLSGMTMDKETFEKKLLSFDKNLSLQTYLDLNDYLKGKKDIPEALRLELENTISRFK